MKKTTITINANIDLIRPVRNLVDRIGRRCALSPKNIHAVKLATEEALTNIIGHGHREKSQGKITIKIYVQFHRLSVIIIDRGISFDPRKVNNPDIKQYIDTGKKGGLGIFMIRRLMDDFHYQITNRGNELHLTKYRASAYNTRLQNIFYVMQYPSKLRCFLPLCLDCGRNMQ